MKRIGVLALQGGFDAHLRTLQAIGVSAEMVRTVEQLNSVDGLILPGGESTTIGKLLELHGLWPVLRQRIEDGLPVLGTCAGVILLAQRAVGRIQPLLGLMDIDVARNAYGRQTESFETELKFHRPGQSERPLSAIFIRAPQIVRTGPKVTVLATYEDLPVCVQQDRLLGATFHPELTESRELHDYFLSLV